jgi:hypothetical protein
MCTGFCPLKMVARHLALSLCHETPRNLDEPLPGQGTPAAAAAALAARTAAADSAALAETAGAEAVVLASWWLLAALCARGAPGLLSNGPVAAEDGGLEEEVRLLLFPERHDALPLLARGGMN